MQEVQKTVTVYYMAGQLRISVKVPALPTEFTQPICLVHMNPTW